MIGIVDYGLGNVKAFAEAFRRLGVEASIVSLPEELLLSKKIVLPGVGSFDHAMSKLSKSGLRNALDTLVLNKGVPILGVCVGMQIMANSSDEGDCEGLGWIDAHVEKLENKERSNEFRLPHMGWNVVDFDERHSFFYGQKSERFYFLHSYKIVPKIAKYELARVNFGESFCAAISFRNIHGTQFHPEKSHSAGLSLLSRFASF